MKTREDTEKVALYKPRRNVSEEPDSANTLISDSGVQDREEIHFCRLSPRPWYSAVTAGGDGHGCKGKGVLIPTEVGHFVPIT